MYSYLSSGPVKGSKLNFIDSLIKQQFETEIVSISECAKDCRENITNSRWILHSRATVINKIIKHFFDLERGVCCVYRLFITLVCSTAGRVQEMYVKILNY